MKRSGIAAVFATLGSMLMGGASVDAQQVPGGNNQQPCTGVQPCNTTPDKNNGGNNAGPNQSQSLSVVSFSAPSPAGGVHGCLGTKSVTGAIAISLAGFGGGIGGGEAHPELVEACVKAAERLGLITHHNACIALIGMKVAEKAGNTAMTVWDDPQVQTWAERACPAKDKSGERAELMPKPKMLEVVVDGRLYSFLIADIKPQQAAQLGMTVVPATGQARNDNDKVRRSDLSCKAA